MRNYFISFVKKYNSLIGFLFIEILALVAFNLANIGEAFEIIGFVLAIALIPFAVLFCHKKELISFLLFSIPLIVFAIVMSVSPFAISGVYSVISNIAFFLGTLSFVFAGFALKRNNGFRIDVALYVIFGLLTLLLFIGLCATMYEYAPMYVTNFKGQYIYYDGHPYFVSDSAKWLIGFSVENVAIDYYGLYGAIVTSSLGALLFLSPKKDLKKFIIFGVFGLIGLLSIIFLPALNALYALISTLIVLLFVRFLRNKSLLMKVVKWIVIVIGILAAIALFILFLNAQSWSAVSGLKSFISNNSILNRLFNTNRYSQAFNQVLSLENAGSWTNLLFGSPYTYGGTGSFEFDIVTEGGLVSFIAVIVFIIFVIVSLVRYLKKSSDALYVKGIIISFLLTLFVYASFFYPSFAMTYKSYYFSFARSMPVLIALFFIGYTYTTKKNYEPIIIPELLVVEKEMKDSSTDELEPEDLLEEDKDETEEN